jgi:hypothetical protein
MKLSDYFRNLAERFRQVTTSRVPDLPQLFHDAAAQGLRLLKLTNDEGIITLANVEWPGPWQQVPDDKVVHWSMTWQDIIAEFCCQHPDKLGPPIQNLQTDADFRAAAELSTRVAEWLAEQIENAAVGKQG